MMGPPASNISFIAGEIEFHEGPDHFKCIPAGTIVLIKRPKKSRKRKATSLPMLEVWDGTDKIDSEFKDDEEILGVGVLHDDVVPRIMPRDGRVSTETTSVIVHGVCNILSCYGFTSPLDRTMGDVTRTGDNLTPIGPTILSKHPGGGKCAGMPPMQVVSSYVKGDKHLRVMLNSAAIHTYIVKA